MDNFKMVNIDTIKQDDVILHNGDIKTVSNNDIHYNPFMGITVFGDSYHSGYKLVKKIIMYNGGVIV